MNNIKPMIRQLSKEPTQHGIDEHNINHARLISWCPHCITCQATSLPHTASKNLESDIPVISIDYAFMNDEKDNKDDKDKGMPIEAINYNSSNMKRAGVVPKKGVGPYAVDRTTRDIEQLVYKTIILKSDQEHSIQTFKQAVRESTNVEIQMEESPVAEHQANGVVEHAISTIQCQFRTMKDALDTRYNKRFSGDHPAIPWLIEHAADTMHRTRESGVTAQLHIADGRAETSIKLLPNLENMSGICDSGLQANINLNQDGKTEYTWDALMKQANAMHHRNDTWSRTSQGFPHNVHQARTMGFGLV